MADAADVCMADLKHLNIVMASAVTPADADDAIKDANEAVATCRVAFRQVSRATHSNENESSHHKIKSAKASCWRI